MLYKIKIFDSHPDNVLANRFASNSESFGSSIIFQYNAPKSTLENSESLCLICVHNR